MNKTIIEINDVSVKFNLERERVNSIKEYLIRRMKGKIEYDEFWALRHVNFKINRGDSVGFVGLNGSGKSTLLKVIAGVLKPTEGNVQIHGTIAPLIELGAGFDFDLTARENVFLNGSILGHSRKEMLEYYDDIVEFSELEEFMDVPVKNFSSGMLSRLAFAIATIGKPDILIVDEVLAVGDFRFQQKCEKRIQNMIGKDTTVLFVSHSIEQVKLICKKAVWLEKGHVKMIGTSKAVSAHYELS